MQWIRMWFIIWIIVQVSHMQRRIWGKCAWDAPPPLKWHSFLIQPVFCKRKTCGLLVSKYTRQGWITKNGSWALKSGELALLLVRADILYASSSHVLLFMGILWTWCCTLPAKNHGSTPEINQIVSPVRSPKLGRETYFSWVELPKQNVLLYHSHLINPFSSHIL